MAEDRFIESMARLETKMDFVLQRIDAFQASKDKLEGRIEKLEKQQITWKGQIGLLGVMATALWACVKKGLM